MDFQRGFSPKGPVVGLVLEKGSGSAGVCSFRNPFIAAYCGFQGRGLAAKSDAMAKSPFKFLQEVRSETSKVTWPTRKETIITTIMVFIMVAVASVFFFVADQIIRVLVTFVLGIKV